MQKFLKKKNYLIIGVVIVAVIGIIGGLIYFKNQNVSQKNDQLFVSSSKTSSSFRHNSSSSTASSKSNQYVEIKGAVVKPGIYAIHANTRLAEILQQAGGATPEADLKTVNLAKVAHDQESFYIPQKGEATAATPTTATTTTTPTTAASSSSTVSSESQNANPASGNSGNLVDLNTADVAKLQTLKGVGEKKAAKIIEYRQTKGNFKKIEDLKNVNGIGDKTYEALKDQITVSN